MNNAPQDYTIAELTHRGTADKWGNAQYTVKFAEYPNQVYAAFKNPPTIGMKRWGTIQADGTNGPAFKSAQKEFNGQPAQSGFSPQPSYQPRSSTPKKSDDERSKDIRWGLCLKEANLYVSKYRPDLDPAKWAQDIIEYASALYAVSAEPAPTATPVQSEQPQPQSPPDYIPEDIDDAPLNLSGIPF